VKRFIAHSLEVSVHSQLALWQGRTSYREYLEGKVPQLMARKRTKEEDRVGTHYSLQEHTPNDWKTYH
jgi:hypothetical protein